MKCENVSSAFIRVVVNEHKLNVNLVANYKHPNISHQFNPLKSTQQPWKLKEYSEWESNWVGNQFSHLVCLVCDPTSLLLFQLLFQQTISDGYVEIKNRKKTKIRVSTFFPLTMFVPTVLLMVDVRHEWNLWLPVGFSKTVLLVYDWRRQHIWKLLFNVA